MENEETIDLKNYSVVAKKWKWVVILVPIMLAIISGAYSQYVIAQMYEANTTLYVVNRNQNTNATIAYSDLMAGQFLVKDFRELVKQRVIASTVISELGLENQYTVGALAEKITVNLKNDTRIFEIKVKDKNPELAFKITEKLADVFSRKVVEVMNVEAVYVIDTPIIPPVPISPNKKLNVAIAFIVGIFLAMGFVIIVEYFDNTIKSAEDVEKYLKLPVLGSVPKTI